MKTLYFLLATILIVTNTIAQVGINNTDPKAILDISSSNVATPANTDGLLIPRIDEFPVTNPGADQDGMMVFATGNGTPSKGFYYWNQTTTAWVSVTGAGGDDDWYEIGGTTAPDNIIDDQYTLGKLKIGQNSAANASLDIYDWNESNRNGLLITRNLVTPSSFGQLSGFTSTVIGSSTDNYTSIRGELMGTPSVNTHTFYGLNTTAPSSGVTYQLYGIFSSNGGSGNLVGNEIAFNTATITNTGDKSGFRTTISPSLSGTHYGMYSNVTSATGYAAYFIGRTSLGNSGANRYLMPATDGTIGQVMTTDGSGQLSFTTPTTGAEKIDDLLDGKSDNDGSDDGSSIFFGVNAGNLDDSSANANIGIGYAALEDNITGTLNVAVGWGSLRENTGNSNTALGYLSAGGNTSGTGNTAIGRNALLNNITGNYNTSLGFFAGYSNAGSGSVFVGTNAGFNHSTGDNILYIENTDADANNALIYGEFGADNSTTGNVLRTNSEFQIGNPATTGFAFPTTDGSANQVLTTDGAGNLSFTAPSSGDEDWLTTPGSNPVTSNTQDIYTSGKVAIGGTTISADFNIYHNEIADGSADIVQYNEVSNSGNDDKTIIRNVFGAAGAGDNTAIYNDLIGNGSGTYYGMFNRSYAAVMGDIYGVSNSITATGGGNHYGIYNLLNGSGNGEKYGVYNSFSSTGTGTKYGTYTNISPSAGGTHYGIYADVTKSGSYAGYFLGGVSIGTTTGNNYIMPTSRGNNGDVIQTDAAGNLSWVDPTTIGDGVGAEKIDDLIDGKSDNDGTQDGSSIFLGIDAGMADNSTDNKNIGIGFRAMTANTDGERNVGIGYFSLLNNTIGDANIAIGDTALIGNTSGNNNTALGVSTLAANSTGDHNVAIGTTAMWRNTTGSRNIGLGNVALFDNTTGSDNIALGYRSLYNLTTGNENIAIGAEAGMTNTTGIGNVYLGTNAGRSHIGNNTLWIENTNANADNALIYGEFDNDILRTNGELQIGNPTGTGYAFPTTDGTNGQVMTTNGSGAISFQTIAGDGDTQNTLDQAYDEGGAGAGRTITANDGAVTIAGQDGFTVTGAINNGDAIAVSGAGSRMFYNPRTSSFRAGTVNSTQWNSVNLGTNSVAFGNSTIASGASSAALGSGNTSSGTGSFTSGYNNIASGNYSVAINEANIASGVNSFTQGFSNTAAATASAAMGLQNNAPSWGEMTVGTNATTYSATSTTSWTGTDRVFTVGNGASPGTRSNAFTIYKNGEVNINDAYSLPTADGTSGQVMTTDGAGTVSFVDLPTKARARITLAANQIETGGGITKVNFDTEDFDIGNNFNLATDVFEVPADGIYRVHSQISMNTSTATGTYDVRIRVDGAQVRRTAFDHPGAGAVIRQCTSLLELTAGQTIDIAFLRPTAGATINMNGALSYFEIEQL